MAARVVIDLPGFRNLEGCVERSQLCVRHYSRHVKLQRGKNDEHSRIRQLDRFDFDRDQRERNRLQNTDARIALGTGAAELPDNTHRDRATRHAQHNTNSIAHTNHNAN
jgi:hypothetical protein